MESKIQVDKDFLKENGYVMVKNVFTMAEVTQFREIAYRLIEEDLEKGTYFLHRVAKNHIGCLTNDQETKGIVLNDKIVNIAREILGDKPVFFGDAILEIGIGSRGWHKDVSYTNDENHEDWQTDNYPIYRIGLYLQDHKDYSGGLKVKEKTHNTLSTKPGKPIILGNQPGDLVIFNLRTTHAGNAVRLKAFPYLSLHNSLEKRIPAFLRKPEEKERVSFFLTFGLKSPQLERYINFMQNHKVYKKRIEASSYPDSLVKEIEQKVDFINLKTYQPKI